MRWSYRIGVVAGTEIKVHVTFLLIVAWWALIGYNEAGPSGALVRAFALLALFACILLHEFGHILMARRFGVRTPDVILLPIGGVARLERIPDEPRQELLIAIAGPAVTLVIAVLLWAVLRLSGSHANVMQLSENEPFLAQLATANIYLLLFNLIPAFPMDGGRVLRALLASRLGLLRGTRIAATLGQTFAVLGGLYGITKPEPILETRLAGEGIQVRQMMVTDFRTIPIHATLNDAVALLLSGEQREFPVVDNLGRTEGILTRDNLIRGLSLRGPRSTVAEAMSAGVPSVPSTLGFQEALDRLRSSRLPALPVIDGGALVGLLTLDNITDLLLVRRARG
jgi:Zn-dependent protease